MDADYDRLLRRELPGNVVLTDGRDLESYALTEHCIAHLSTQGLALNQNESLQIFKRLVQLARPVGALRLLSERQRIKLPFQKTLKKGLGRFMDGKTNVSLDRSHLVKTLLQNADMSIVRCEEIVELWRLEEEAVANVEHEQIIHGKDFISVLSCIVNLGEIEIERLIFASLDTREVVERRNVARTRHWVQNVPS